MSRVFVAEDTELGRNVVIKVLPPDLAAGLNVERFRREIQMAARLQHPHVVPLLWAGAKDGLLYYTMPLISGETLRAKLARSGELPIAEAVRVLREVADALEYAHGQGVVHRDIKPENVLFAGNHAVVTDFGVSKALSSATGEQSLTSIGVALGTPAYMSPEQATADPNTDHRTDIYALGVLGYELLTGRPPFTGATPQQILAAQVTEPPPQITGVRQTIPPALAAVIMRCLEKRPADRWQSAEEVRIQLESLSTPSGGTQPVSAVNVPQARPVRGLRRNRTLVLGGAAAAILLLSLFAGKYLGQRGPAFTVGQTRQVTTGPEIEITPALSPDGSMVAYYSGVADAIFVRQVGGGTPVRVAAGIEPRWSPDGSQIAFTYEGGIFVVPALGGSPRRVISGEAYSPAWSPDGARIAYAMSDDRIYVADSTGRNARPVTEAPDAHSVAWSPDGKRLAFVSQNSGWVFGFNIAPSSIWIVNADGSGKIQVTGATQLNTSPVWMPDGSGLLFVSGLAGGRDVYYQPLPRSGPPRDPPQRVTTGLSLHGIAISGDGKRIAYTTFNRAIGIWSIPIPTRGPVSAAAARQITAESERIEAVSVTQDGEWLAFDSDRGGNHDIYSMRAATGETRQLTRDPADEFNPAWSPDGSEIAFHSWRSGNRDSYVVSADGTRERLIAGGPSHEYAGRWSPDGKQIVFASDRTGRSELYVVGRDGGTPRQITSSGASNLAEWSPDGRWLAYSSRNVLYIVPPAGGPPRELLARADIGAIDVSMAAWSPDSRTLYFRMGVPGSRNLDIGAVGVDGSSPRVLVRFDQPEHVTFRAEFAADARNFYFTLGRGDGDLWIMDLARK